jgi:hypothetical protein
VDMRIAVIGLEAGNAAQVTKVVELIDKLGICKCWDTM